MTDTAVETLPEKHAGGRPPEVTHNDAKDYLKAISEGLTQDQAADIVGFDRRTMEKWVKVHPELSAESSRARAKCVRKQIRSLNDISAVRDVKGLNAAGKAAMFLLAGYDDRFRKARDGEGAGGGGTTINVITAVQPQSVAGFFAAGGKAQPQMVKLLIQKYGQGILGEITEETALRIAEESVSENDSSVTIDVDPMDKSPSKEDSTSDNRHSVTLSEDGARASKINCKKKNGTQSEDQGGRRPSDARTHTPNHPRNKSEVIDADTSDEPIKTSVDSSPPLPESVVGPLDPIPAPAAVEEAPNEA